MHFISRVRLNRREHVSNETAFLFSWVTARPQNRHASDQCETKPKRYSRLLYPGDSAHFDCSQGTRWLQNNASVDLMSARHFFTVDGGLIIVNVSYIVTCKLQVPVYMLNSGCLHANTRRVEKHAE